MVETDDFGEESSGIHVLDSRARVNCLRSDLATFA